MENILCILCKPSQNISPGKTVKVTKGLRKIIECSAIKGDNVKELVKDKTTVEVHIKCRKDYTRHIEGKGKVLNTHAARKGFDFKSQCEEI